MAARGTRRQILSANRSHVGKLRRIPPNLQKLLLTHVTAGKRKLHARKYFTAWRDIARGMPRAARESFHRAFVNLRGRRANLCYVAHQGGILKHAAQALGWQP